MKRKIFSALMFGALAVASTTFTSCKDYDDDIKDLQTQIDAISPALESTKTALQQEISNLKSELQAKDAELATLIQQAKDAANSAAADAATNADVRFRQPAAVGQLP